jgi:hypothetical protein
MSNFTHLESENFKIIHHSTSMVYEIIIYNDDKEGVHTVWLDYYEMHELSDLLIKMIKQD